MLSQVDWLGIVGVEKIATIKRTDNKSTEIRRRIRKKLTFLNFN